MPTHIAYRTYFDVNNNREEEEIIFAEDAQSIQGRFFKEREKNFEQRDYPNAGMGGASLSLASLGSRFGLFWSQGGGLGSLSPRWDAFYEVGNAKKAYEELITALESTK